MDEQLTEGILQDAERAFDESQVPSLSIALGVDGEVAAARAWGFADTEHRVPATPDTAYLLASVTKPITATAIGLLVSRGLLALDSPLSDALGFRLRQFCSGPEPTIADLLGHRSGIGRYYRFFYSDTADTPDPDFSVTARRHAVVTTTPGQNYEYSNLGYGVLDHVIETVAFAPPSTFAATEIFDLVRMPSACIGPRYDGRATSVAERYGTDGTAYPPYDVEHRGASLAWGTARDIVRFGLSHCESGSLMQIPEIRRQHDPSVAGSNVGHSWRLASADGEAVISHSGGMGGVSSLLLVCPGRNIAVVALVNQTYSELAREVAHHAMSTLLSRSVGRRIESKPNPALPPVLSLRSSPAHGVGAWTGEVQTEVGSWPVRLELHRDGSATLGDLLEPGDHAARFLPPDGHDLRLAVPWCPSGSSADGGAVCLDINRHESGFRGKIGITDLAGAGLAVAISDGGVPGRRHGDYVTYPIELFVDWTAGRRS